MSDTELNPAFIDASDAPIPAENGSREVEYAPPPLGSEETGGSDDGVAARTRRQVHLRNAAGVDILDHFLRAQELFSNVLVTNEGFRVEAPWS